MNGEPLLRWCAWLAMMQGWGTVFGLVAWCLIDMAQETMRVDPEWADLLNTAECYPYYHSGLESEKAHPSDDHWLTTARWYRAEGAEFRAAYYYGRHVQQSRRR